jgi:transcriptional regulator with XRE-family HTH domain
VAALRAARINKTLRELREAAGLSQQDLAVRSGLSISAVRQIEQGNKPDPRVSTVLALAAALRVNCEALAGEPRPIAKRKQLRR